MPTAVNIREKKNRDKFIFRQQIIQHYGQNRQMSTNMVLGNVLLRTKPAQLSELKS
jgi:hypothetical protein